MFFGSKKKPESKETEFAKLRQRQITEFETAVPIARPIDAAKSAYDVPVQTQFGRLIFRVMLDANFPERAPHIRVMMKVTHPWVDAEMYVQHEKLTNWGPYNNVGKIVSEIYNEFVKNPPAPQLNFVPAAGSGAAANPVMRPAPQPMMAIPAVGAGGNGVPVVMAGGGFVQSPMMAMHVPGGPMPMSGGAAGSPLPMTPSPNPFAAPMNGGMPHHSPPSSQVNNKPVPPARPSIDNSQLKAAAGGGGGGGGGSGSAAASPASGGGANAGFKTPVPPIPSAFPELDAFSSAQLEDLLSDDASQLQEMVANRDSVTAMRETRTDLLNGTEALAKKNLTMRDELSALSASVRALKQSVDAKQQQLNGLQDRQARVLSKYSLKGVLQILTDELERLDERADQLQRKYKRDGDGEDEDDNGGRKSAGMDDDDNSDVKSVSGASSAAISLGGSAASFGKLNHAEFCKQFIKLRKLFHARSALKERLIELYGRS